MELSKLNIFYIIKSEEDRGCLLIGDRSSCSQAILQENNIGAVVTAVDGQKLNFGFNQQIDLLELVGTVDDKVFRIDQYFDVVNEFIEKNISSTNVLIACETAQSRSAILAAAYILKKEQLMNSDCVKRVLKANPDAYPSFNFQEQLAGYYIKLTKCKPDFNHIRRKVEKVQTTPKPLGQKVQLQTQKIVGSGGIQSQTQEKKPKPAQSQKLVEKPHLQQQQVQNKPAQVQVNKQKDSSQTKQVQKPQVQNSGFQQSKPKKI